MSGKAKTAQKRASKGKDLGPNDRGYRHTPPNVVRVLAFKRGPKGFLRPKMHFERSET